MRLEIAVQVCLDVAHLQRLLVEHFGWIPTLSNLLPAFLEQADQQSQQ